MKTERRTVLGVLAGVLGAGCSSPSTETPSENGSPGEDGSPTESRTDTVQCNPEDVTRPPVATDTNIGGREYPQKPSTLTEQSILEYLDDFETAFAWNRVLESTANVTSVNIDNLDGFDPDETGDGYLASSGIRVSYSTEDGSTTEREYIANYFVSPGPVYRYESSSNPVTPQEQEETVLVQCGADT